MKIYIKSYRIPEEFVRDAIASREANLLATKQKLTEKYYKRYAPLVRHGLMSIETVYKRVYRECTKHPYQITDGYPEIANKVVTMLEENIKNYDD